MTPQADGASIREAHRNLAAIVDRAEHDELIIDVIRVAHRSVAY
jgi:hypothetical protein